MSKVEQMKKCEACGTNFSIKEGEEWKTICLPCWKKKKNGVDPTKRRIEDLEWQLRVARYELEQARRRAGDGAIDQQMVKRLLQLCHPDKHNNSEASRRATQWLLTKK